MGSQTQNVKTNIVVPICKDTQTDKISAGAKFNKVLNKDFIGQFDYYRYSFYLSIEIIPKWNVYAWYDIMDSSSPVVLAKLWNDNNQLIIASIE